LKLKELPTWENFLSYKEEEAKAKSGLRKIKKVYFKNFYNSVNQYTSQSYSYIWEKISKLKGKKVKGKVVPMLN
jgi:Golgi nucleoside diphosphatase